MKRFVKKIKRHQEPAEGNCVKVLNCWAVSAGLDKQLVTNADAVVEAATVWTELIILNKLEYKEVRAGQLARN